MASAIQTLMLTGNNDFGLVQRGADDVAVCSESGAFNRAEMCKLVDDAIVYYQMRGPDAMNALFAKMGSPPASLPNMPPGRLVEFYRIIAAIRFAQQIGGRALTLKELLFVVEAGAEDRGREDDFYRTRTLVKAVLKAPLSPEEQAFIATVQTGLSRAQGGGFAVALAAGTGGFFVGGPVGAAVGFVVGLVAGGK